MARPRFLVISVSSFTRGTVSPGQSPQSVMATSSMLSCRAYSPFFSAMPL